MSSILIDISLVVVLILSLLIGAYRGLIRSLLSLLSWVIAAWVTWKYASLAEPLIEGMDLGPTVQLIFSHLLVFFVVLLIMSVLSTVLARAVDSEGFAAVDRTLGVAFGIVRGVLIILIVAVIGAYLFGVDEPWWRDSKLLSILGPWVSQIQMAISQYQPPTGVVPTDSDISQIPVIISEIMRS